MKTQEEELVEAFDDQVQGLNETEENNGKLSIDDSYMKVERSKRDGWYATLSIQNQYEIKGI